MKRKIPIGISDFKKLIQEEYLYVDKSLLIQELVERGVNKVTLLPRPRRFGKTLNLSMLRYFFEKSDQDNSALFTSLHIWQHEKYKSMQGQFPVIFITLKDVKHDSWSKTYLRLRRIIAEEFRKHRYLLESGVLDAQEKNDFYSILQDVEDLSDKDQVLLEESLLLLSKWLYRYHKKAVILLIDEYDTPAHAAYVGGYYETLISFLRNWLSAGLKDNSYLEFGVLTGILRIAKESIFSGLNNISTFSILSQGFQDKFGFLETEVEALAQEYGLTNKLDEMRRWYNGYVIGSTTEIYNPWSVLKCIESQGKMEPYWVNTSDNALITQLITGGSDFLKKDLEELLKDGSIEKTLYKEIIFSQLQHNSQAIWSLLLFSGYLSIGKTANDEERVALKIPNFEVKKLFQTMVLDWFKESINEEQYELMLRSLVSGDMAIFTEIFEQFVLSTFSTFDVTGQEPERVYHAFVLGLLVSLTNRYEIKSNRESGLGRYDVILFPKNSNDLGIIMEFKKVKKGESASLDEVARLAIKQILNKKYSTELTDRGITKILAIGFAFKGKEVRIATTYNY